MKYLVKKDLDSIDRNTLHLYYKNMINTPSKFSKLSAFESRYSILYLYTIQIM